MGDAFTAAPGFRSWGGAARPLQHVARPRFADQLPGLLRQAPAGGALAVGLARSYGDSGLNSAGGLIDMSGLDRLIVFDAENGVVRAEAGLSLEALLKLLAPRSMFTTTTPGTAQVTLGGAVANDVHGKNHHSAGAFGCGVRRLGLLRTTGEQMELAPGDPLFAATIGGLGLTGVITWVELQLAQITGPYIDNEDVPFGDLGGFFDLAAESAGAWEHTAAWIDVGRGRGIFSRGAWTSQGEGPQRKGRLSAPIEPPVSPLNPLSLRVFNEVVFAAKSMGVRRRTVPYSAALHPLDSVAGWNRLYGRKGFWQHQSVVPAPSARDAVAEMLGAVAKAGEGSFLSVLKTFGERASPGLLSFPRGGATLAMDFPARGPGVLKLMDRLDAIVREAGGRIYAAKDGRMSADMMRAGYPRLDEFLQHLDPGLSSDFARRTLGVSA
ncbi:MAG: FAD-binding oxidoreductase [Phenylobacterium sp.]|uniref:FAD-binding oxidoreductase n=1 Tax=Phenylobacterium sp. TaxID=1871053 RepID=UPI002732EBF5|nr:FAD-binding oxidoreductase [Phenylobacterium sp.]MDP3175699.1 FAD-binding oxidoreductase [Phenylobacterium sp.]